MCSWRKQSQWQDSYAIRPPVGGGSGVDDDGVQQSVADLLAEPAQVTHVLLLDGVSQFHFDGNDAAVSSREDEVGIVVAVSRAQVADVGLGGLRGDPHAQGDQ